MQKEVFKRSEYAHATTKTIQLKIIKRAALVKEMKTKIRKDGAILSDKRGANFSLPKTKGHSCLDAANPNINYK